MKYFFLIFLYTNVVLGEIIQRTYRKDGTKEFQIVKHIKGNKCDCSCQCNPQNQLKIFDDTTTPSLPITTVLLKEDDITKNVENINLGHILSTNSKSINLKTVDVSAETNIVTNEENQFTTINPIVTTIEKSSNNSNLNNFEEKSLTITSVENTQFEEKFTTIKVNNDDSSLEENIETTSGVTINDINISTTTILPILTDQLTIALNEETTTTLVDNETKTPLADNETTTPLNDNETTNNPIITTKYETSTQINDENLNSIENSTSLILSTDDNIESTNVETNLPNESIITTTALPSSLSTEETQISETLQTFNFESTSQPEQIIFETVNKTDLFEPTTTIDTTISTKIKNVTENESTETFSEDTTVSTQENELINNTTSVKKDNDLMVSTQQTINLNNKNDTEKILEKEKTINELGLKISDSNDTNFEEDIPEAEFSDTEKSEHISNNIINTTSISINDNITKKPIELETTTSPIINININHNVNNITKTTPTTTIQTTTTTENESEDVAFKIEEIEDKSEEEVTEIIAKTILTTPSTIIESTTKEIETFNVSDILYKIENVTEKVNNLDSLQSNLTKEIYNIVSEIRSKFENTSTSLKINENDQRLIQTKWSKLINKLREKLAILQTKKIHNDETLNTIDFVTSQPTTPSITIFFKKYKEPIKTDFSINENPTEENVSKSINTIENRLEEAKILREKQEKADFDEKLSIEKTLDVLAEKERILREQADRKRLHFSPNQLNKARTIGDTTLIRQPIRRIPDLEEIDDTIKLPQIQCEPVRNFIKIFKINDPKVWIQENCQFVKQYFPSASCVQIKDVLISCL